MVFETLLIHIDHASRRIGVCVRTEGNCVSMIMEGYSTNKFKI